VRIRPRASALLVTTAFAAIASAAFAMHTPPATPVPDLRLEPQRTLPHANRVLSFRSLAAQIDNQVVANLLSEPPARHNDLPLTVVAGEISRCESQTCVVPVTLRVADAQGPVSLTFAVANAKGELSDVHHAECGAGECTISLILERGRNTVSIGVMDGLAQTAGFTMLRVNAVRAIAEKGRTEWF
jgi:hypothetical protein